MVADERIRSSRRGPLAADGQQHPCGPRTDHHRAGLHGTGSERRGILVVDGYRDRDAGAQANLLRERRQQSSRCFSHGKEGRQLSRRHP